MPHFIFIQQISILNILNMLYNLHFFSSKCRLFHSAALFGFCITHVLNTGCAKIWNKLRRQKVKVPNAYGGFYPPCYWPSYAYVFKPCLWTYLKLCFLGIVCEMYNALVRALQCHFLAGKDIRNVEFEFPSLLKPEKEKCGVIFQVMLLNMTVLHRFIFFVL